MRDDTRADEAGSGGFAFSTNIDSILQHRFRRTSAARWARNLRFLTFAGDDECTDTQSSERFNSTKGLHLRQCTRCELRVPPPAGHICAAHAHYRKDIEAYEKRAKNYDNPCVHVEDASCEECLQIPLFPNRGRATKFRIRRLKPKGTKPSELGRCTHYVAVSYCCSYSGTEKPGERNADREAYQVIEEDMETVRSIRAPKGVIDRAVSFAAQNGFRMIWIDQVIELLSFVIFNYVSPDRKQRNASSRTMRTRKKLVSKRWTMCMLMRTCPSVCSKQHSNNAISTLCCCFLRRTLGRICDVVVHIHSRSVEISTYTPLPKL